MENLPEGLEASGSALDARRRWVPPVLAAVVMGLATWTYPDPDSDGDGSNSNHHGEDAVMVKSDESDLL